MPGRRRARELVLQALYDADLAGLSPQQALRSLQAALLDDDGTLGQGRLAADESDFAAALARGVQGNLQRIDALIEEASLNWRLVRMPVVDRNIGGDDSRAFVNGILDRVAHDIGRGGRGPRRG